MEFPHLEELVKKYGRRGLVMITVNTHPEWDADGVEFMAKKGYHFTHLTAPADGWAASEYEFWGAPTTVLLDQQGREILRHVGFTLPGLRAMEAGIDTLLQQGTRAR